MDMPTKKELACSWFKNLRDQICLAIEQIEKEYKDKSKPPTTFQRKQWQREGGGGGEMSIMKSGNIFEKAGVNISTVYGHFSEEFSKHIPGAQEDPSFWASGISIVIHPLSPLVPIVHFNTRFIVTTESWFGGGADLTPIFPVEKDTQDFHQRLKQACDDYDLTYYQKFKQWCDDYFFIKHRNEARGVGGIFYDNLNSANWQQDFNFTKEVGRAFLDIYPQIVRRHMHKTWDKEQKQAQLEKRGRYVEFNLIYDRGTKFGLMTNGNIEAIFMSLPPEASWT